MIAFAHFVHDLYTSFLAPLLPLIIEKLSITLSQAGLLSTVMQIPSLANPFIGLFADNSGHYPFFSHSSPPQCFLIGNVSMYLLHSYD